MDAGTHGRTSFNLPELTSLWGCLQEETYEQVARELKNFGLIENIPDFHQFYRNCESAHEK